MSEGFEKHLILFVDDDQYEMLPLVERLEVENFIVKTAASPAMAKDILISGIKPSLIISDLIMPDAAADDTPLSKRYVGVEFCRYIKEQIKLTCPIIVLTVVNDDDVRREVRKYADAMLLKPVTPRSLLQRVKEVLKG